MSISRLEAELLEAQARYNTMKNVPLEESIAAKQTLLSAERALSLAKGEETALACEWEVAWEPNSPMPHIMASGGKTYLKYIVEDDSNWDGSSDMLTIALVKFIDCYAYIWWPPTTKF